MPDSYLVSKEALCNLREVVMNGERTADTVSLPTQPPPQLRRVQPLPQLQPRERKARHAFAMCFKLA